MKKLSILSALALVVSLTSCKKNYTCDCSGNSSTGSITYTAKMKKKDAQTWCTSWDNSYKSVGGGSCSLK
jgi:uncharacterized lipoprotein YehR (DUF1307 family)